MDLLALDKLFRAWVLVALVVGAYLVTHGDVVLGSIGVVVIILGLMGLMPLVRNGMTDSERGPSAP